MRPKLKEKIPEEIAGRFQPLRLLGKGGMGEVWLAHDQVTGEQIAVKTISPEQVRLPIGERHRREFRQLHRLQHPSILKVHDYGCDVDSGCHWFTSEVLRGSMSTDLSGALDLKRWWQLCGGFLRALSFMHRNGWVHGDIKPDNVRLRSVPNDQVLDPVLLDFGLTRREDRPAEEKILGTPHAMAPEQWLGEPPDRRSDVYSAGVMLYHWWTGQFPFHGTAMPLLSGAHLNQECPDPNSIRKGLPFEISELILKMVAKRPDDRPENAGEVLARLSGIIESDVSLAGDNICSLKSQLEYAGAGKAPVDALVNGVIQNLKLGKTPESIFHIHRYSEDRRRILSDSIRELQYRGISVVQLEAHREDPLKQLASRLSPQASEAVVVVRDPGTGSLEWKRLLELDQWKNTKLCWVLSSEVLPGGFFGELRTRPNHIVLNTDTELKTTLTDWLATALPGGQLPQRLLSRLETWGQGKPGMWKRILLGRLRSGELGHDGQRWTWKTSISPPEDRWRQRASREVTCLKLDEQKILQVLAILGAPAPISVVAQLAGISAREFPALISGLISQRWLRMGSDLSWRAAFQADGVLAAMTAEQRRSWHSVAARLQNPSFLDTAVHLLNGGHPLEAAKELEDFRDHPERSMSAGCATVLATVIPALMRFLPETEHPPWWDLLGKVEDSLGQHALRDHAWRMSARFHPVGSFSALRLARWRAHVTRRDGNPKQALGYVEEVSAVKIDFSNPMVVHEAARLAVEYSRIQRCLVRQGLGRLSETDPLEDWVQRCSGPYRSTLIFEQCRRALLKGCRLRAKDLARQGLDLLEGHDVTLKIVEGRCLLARAMDDLSSLIIWSKLFAHLARQANQVEAATAAEIEAMETLQQLGEVSSVRRNIVSLVKQARIECPVQLPRALLISARVQAGWGFIRSAARDIEEALSLEGPAGIVAWEGNLLVAASEWIAGRPQTALKILEAAPPEMAPHEPERIDVHARHAILKSRCVISQGDPSSALFILDSCLTKLRLRGTEKDLISIRNERIVLLESLGQNSMARMEKRRLGQHSQKVSGLDPEPVGSHRARENYRRYKSLMWKSHTCEEKAKLLEVVALDALRLKSQPLSLRLQLDRSHGLSAEEREALARQGWKRAVRLESREGRALVLMFWAQARRDNNDVQGADKLARSAERELDRWVSRAPAGCSRKALGEMLGIHCHAPGQNLGIGGRNTQLL